MKRAEISNSYEPSYRTFISHSTVISKVQHKIDARRSNFLAWLIIALCTARTVNYQRLSLQIGTDAKTQSNYRRIQRFMESTCLSMMVIAQIIYQCLGITSDKQVLIMDRTNWKFGEQNINILMLAIKHNDIAYPLMFKLLNKRGNSNTVLFFYSSASI